MGNIDILHELKFVVAESSEAISNNVCHDLCSLSRQAAELLNQTRTGTTHLPARYSTWKSGSWIGQVFTETYDWSPEPSGMYPAL
jgi:hypothetical protein